jgi:hypothetical protein
MMMMMMIPKISNLQKFQKDITWKKEKTWGHLKKPNVHRSDLKWASTHEHTTPQIFLFWGCTVGWTLGYGEVSLGKITQWKKIVLVQKVFCIYTLYFILFYLIMYPLCLEGFALLPNYKWNICHYLLLIIY